MILWEDGLPGDDGDLTPGRDPSPGGDPGGAEGPAGGGVEPTVQAVVGPGERG
jgi:hypothetical protein